ncbi:hypothetical protein FRB90_004614 [Tulasnella sp. 427]|nr:hypothetical protein FRB90_004614 [Tulasnella sp. 427]
MQPTIEFSSLIKGPYLGGGTYAEVNSGTLNRSGVAPIKVAMKYLKLRSLSSSVTAEQIEERMIKRFNRESKVWERVVHPNIVRFEGWTTSPAPINEYILVSELCPNGDLQTYIQGHQGWDSLGPRRRLELALGVARGLEYLHTHAEQICHGDLKPNNVVLGEDFVPKLCDFGLAGTMTSLLSDFETTGQPEGGAYFEPYEVWMAGTRSIRGDIFSFAGLLLFVMSSVPPFLGMDSVKIGMEMLKKGVTPARQDHPQLPGSEPLWVFMEQCWALAPAARPDIQACIDAVSEALTRYPN